MFSGKYELIKDNEGRYFLDRPPEPFEIILNSLRTDKKIILPKNEDLKNILLSEILYFELNEYFGIKI
jgi:hypothetical protein